MFATVWRILRHSQDAEDALQSALTTIWQQQNRIASHPSPHALILKICADAAIDHFRQRVRNKSVSLDCEDGISSVQPCPLDKAISSETVDRVLEAVSRLSPNQSTAFVMRFIQGESESSIATALDCGHETVREHLARAKRRLSHMLPQLAPHGEQRETSRRTSH